jgi:hypothetical protein
MRRPSLRDVRDLCRLYQLDEATSSELMNLAQGARQQGWWTQYAEVSVEPYIALEAEATAMACYSMSYVPGQDSGFVLLEFGEPSLSPVVYVEGLTGSRYLDREADVELYRQAMRSLCDAALDPHDSIRRLHELRSLFSDE